MSSSDTNAVPADSTAWLHFAGVGGSGMSALAQFHALAGGKTSGSDRAFDCDERGDVRAHLEKLGVSITPQDGSFLSLHGSRQPDAVVVSTAVEDRVPDIRRAREHGVPILHRSELLARYVAEHRTIAITGTSGKSTVTAMVFTILRECGLGPGLLTGGPLAALVEAGHVGNAWAPDLDAVPEDGRPLLVIEADESDGSVVRYHPWAGVVLNLGLDHKSPDEVLEMFHAFRQNTRGPFLVGEAPNLRVLAEGATRFGVAASATAAGDCQVRNVELTADGSRFDLGDVSFDLPVPGQYNVLNAAAAIAVCRVVGLDPVDMVAPLAGFRGVARRFQSVGTAAGVEVIDDFAHNPDKIAAALAAAHNRLVASGHSNGRVLAVFQPHGFGPTRFLKDALVDMFATSLDPNDILWMPEIFFAGGTVTKNISATDLTDAIGARNRDARFLATRPDLAHKIAAEARPGDLVLVMGARDPSLTDFCRAIVAALVG